MASISKHGVGEVSIGRNCSIGEGVSVHFSAPGAVTIGDYVAIGDNVRVMASGGDVHIGDWTTLHSDCLVMSTKGVRVGMFSQLWTHVAAGEQIEGCTLFGATPSVIENDVWLVGTCTLGSGVTVGQRTVALAGSNITKSCPANSTLAGAPAKVKEGISFYREVSLDEKFEMLRHWLQQYLAESAVGSAKLAANDGAIVVEYDLSQKVAFFKTAAAYEDAKLHPEEGVTLCCVENKKYVKVFSQAEKAVLKYLEGNKARFYD